MNEDVQTKFVKNISESPAENVEFVEKQNYG